MRTARPGSLKQSGAHRALSNTDRPNQCTGCGAQINEYAARYVAGRTYCGACAERAG